MLNSNAEPAGQSSAKTQTGPPAKPPPLEVDKEAPLLIDGPPAKTAKTAKTGQKMADNSPCFVCHVNFAEEEIALQHSQVGVGCVDCHGASYAHRNDENNTTPPDTIYPARKIDAACEKCHPQHNAPAKKVIATWQKRCPEKKDAKALVCTDCHGHHRLAIRTVRWNKETRELLK
jgi:hypothetical protein